MYVTEYISDSKEVCREPGSYRRRCENLSETFHVSLTLTLKFIEALKSIFLSFPSSINLVADNGIDLDCYLSSKRAKPWNSLLYFLRSSLQLSLLLNLEEDSVDQVSNGNLLPFDEWCALCMVKISNKRIREMCKDSRIWFPLQLPMLVPHRKLLTPVVRLVADFQARLPMLLLAVKASTKYANHRTKIWKFNILFALQGGGYGGQYW